MYTVKDPGRKTLTLEYEVLDKIFKNRGWLHLMEVAF